MNRFRAIFSFACLCFLGAIGAWQLSRSTTFQVFGLSIAQEAIDKPYIALTFDDGPAPKYLHGVLETLAEK